jgi:sigma-E factor negative regulatory protein RseA
MSGEWLDPKGLSERARERLSALVDGEAAGEDLHSVLGAGRENARVLSVTCETWHAYHLIGDVMRSEDLAGAGRDGAFLERLRGQLAKEPVVVAPAASAAVEAASGPAEWRQVAQGVPVAKSRRRSWVAPLAAAAGVMVVTGGLVAMRVNESPESAPSVASGLAQSTPTASVEVVAQKAPAPEELKVVTANGTLVRDARLDQYLSAHKQFGGSSALGVPSGFLRSATYEGPSR